MYLFLFCVVLLLFSLVFWVIFPEYEGIHASLLHSLLFVLETVTTTGYGEYLPFESEVMNIYTVILMVVGITLFLNLVNLVIGPALEARVNPKPPEEIPGSLSNHVIVCGYNDAIREVIDELTLLGAYIILIEPDRGRALQYARETSDQVFILWRDPGLLQTWEKACVRDAAYIILQVMDDEAVHAILQIRDKTRATIVVVTKDRKRKKYLKIAGADQILAVKEILGLISVRYALFTRESDVFVKNRAVQEVMHLTSPSMGRMRIVRIPIIAGSRVIGRKIRDLQLYEQYGFRVLMVQTRGVSLLSLPDDFEIPVHAVLMTIGPSDHIPVMLKEVFIAGECCESVIIAGVGYMGSIIRYYIRELGYPITCIDLDPLNSPDIIGSAEEEEVLLRAGIKESGILMAVTGDDDTNLLSVLMARSMNPGISIFARASSEKIAEGMYRAGADYVVVVPSVIAQSVGRIVVFEGSEILATFPDGRRLVVTTAQKPRVHTCSGLSRRSGMKIASLQKGDALPFEPGGSVIVGDGDIVYGIGNDAQVKRFIRLLRV